MSIHVTPDHDLSTGLVTVQWINLSTPTTVVTCYLQALSLYTPTSKVTSIQCRKLNLTEERKGQYIAMP